MCLWHFEVTAGLFRELVDVDGKLAKYVMRKAWSYNVVNKLPTSSRKNILA